MIDFSRIRSDQLLSIASLKDHPGWQELLSYLQACEDYRLDDLEDCEDPEKILHLFHTWRSYRKVRKEAINLVESFVEENQKLSPFPQVEETL